MSSEEKLRPADEVRRVFERLDGMKSATEEDTFKFGMHVGKLLALGWVLGEVVTSDVALQYEFDDWLRDAKAQEDELRKHLDGLKDLLGDSPA